MGDLGSILFTVMATMAVLLGIWLVSGKRQMGELTPLDFAVSVTAGTVAGASIADPRIELSHSLVSLVCLGLLQIAFSWLTMKYRAVYSRMNYEPTVVVENGQMIKANLRQARLTAELLLQLLREKDVFDITEVELAVFEASGKLSVLKKAEAQPLTASRLGYTVAPNRLLLPVVLEGELQEATLRRLGFTAAEIERLRAEYASRLDGVYVAFMDKERQLHVVKEDVTAESPLVH